jgi:asparagine synthase (glutamine-hydrolysing)
VAVASRLLAEQGRGPLKTFSGVGPDPETCIETRSIHASLTMPGLDPQLISHAELEDYAGDLIRLIRECDEPFDGNWVLNRSVYLAARRSGVRVMLDGGAGDVSLGHGDWLARLLRKGKLAEFRSELKGISAFWGFSTARMGVAYAASAFAPEWMRSIKQKAFRSLLRFRLVHRSAMHPDFARKVDLAARLNAFQQTYPKRRLSFPLSRAHVITHTYLAVGRERCDRVASALAIEPRDPFMDLRVIDFCLRLPGRQLVREGWPKWILRQAMTGLLPDAVRWRRGKQHLGATFRGSLMEHWDGWPDLASEDELVLANFIRADRKALAQRTQRSWFQVILGHWLANIRRSARASLGDDPSNRG